SPHKSLAFESGENPAFSRFRERGDYFSSVLGYFSSTFGIMLLRLFGNTIVIGRESSTFSFGAGYASCSRLISCVARSCTSASSNSSHFSLFWFQRTVFASRSSRSFVAWLNPSQPSASRAIATLMLARRARMWHFDFAVVDE